MYDYKYQALLAKCKYMEATGTDDEGNKMTEETGRRPFSKVSAIVNLFAKFSGALTPENLCPRAAG